MRDKIFYKIDRSKDSADNNPSGKLAFWTSLLYFLDFGGDVIGGKRELEVCWKYVEAFVETHKV